MTNFEVLKTVTKNLKGMELRTSEIKNLSKKKAIQPSDFCNNHRNKDPFSGKYHVFKRLDRGVYKVLNIS